MKRILRMLAPLAAVALVGIGSVASAAPAPGGNGATSAVPSAKQVSLKADPQAPSGVTQRAATCEWPVTATNTYLSTKTVTSSAPRNYFGTAWTNLECGQLLVAVPSGQRGGLVVRTDAEVTCTGPTPDQTQWCQGRVLVNGVVAYPRALEADGSFAWAQSSSDAGAWESNSFTRSLTLTCPRSPTGARCVYVVQVQVQNHTTGLNFRVDDSTVEAQVTYYV